MRSALSISLSLLMLVLLPLAAVGQTEPGASVPPSPSASPALTSPDDAEPTLAFKEPRWKRLSPARSPAAREDHTWTVDADGRFAYLFGGRDGGKSFDDLWRYDLETDRWEKLSPRGKGPSARFGHSAVWADGHGVVVFAGQRGADFFGDLWAYDPGSGRWTELRNRGASPKRRYGSCMIVGPDDRIWISHGFTFTGRFDDTRAYNLKTQRWANIAPDGRRPGERCLHDCFTSSNGQMVLYGGQDNSQRALGDLWMTRANGTWKRENDPRARDRRLYAVTEAGRYAYIFGGAGKDDRALDDLWRVDRATLRFKRVNVPGPTPSARFAGTMVTDPVRGRVLLFGGKSKDARADLWELGDRSESTQASDASPAPSASLDASVAPAASEEAAQRPARATDRGRRLPFRVDAATG